MSEGRWDKPKYLPFNAILNYWCGDDEGCFEIKKYNLIQACETGKVLYSRKKHADLTAQVVALVAKDNLLINLESFEEWVLNKSAKSKVTASDKTEDKVDDFSYWDLSIKKESEEEINSWFDENVESQPSGNDAFDKIVNEQKEWLEQVKRGKESNQQLPPKEQKGKKEKFASEKTYLLIIAILLEFIVGKHKEKTLRNDAHLKGVMCAIYDNLVGISASTLEHQFAHARNLLKKKHDTKTDEVELLKQLNM